MTNKKGLCTKEAQALLAKYGFNELSHSKKTSWISIFFSQFKDFITIVLIISTVVSFFLGETSDAITILIILLLNAILGFVQEFKTEKSLDALKNLSSPKATVIRDGKKMQILAKEIVPGDLVFFESGDSVCADCRIIDSSNVQADEAILTGESVPVSKNKSDNMLYMGTTITAGRASAEVTSTGMRTKMGQIAHMITNSTPETTPLKKSLNKIGKELVIICLGVCLVIFIAGVFHGESIYNMFFSAVTLAVAAIPEGLPAVVTVALAIGVNRMLKRNALIRKLPAVETLGATNVICTDKTGTLTENKMTVKKIYCDNKIIDVTGSGYDVDGDFLIDGKVMSQYGNKCTKKLFLCGALCNNAEIAGKNFFGDPTEIAIYVASIKAKVYQSEIDMHKRIFEIPFDSGRKLMSVVCTDNQNEKYLYVKGAADKILSLCSEKLESNTTKPFTDKSKVLKVHDNMTKQALRVLGFAYKKLPDDINLSDKSTYENLEKNLTFLGLEAMIDPPRKEAYVAIKSCYQAHIRPVMITGDHKNTACAIASELGFEKCQKAILGDEIDSMSDDELLAAIDETDVFARVSPEGKLRIVKAFKRRKNIVAMTGDGVNDAPSLKEADIGVAMGKSGTDVAKEVSDMVLLDDNFATIVSSVEEGRMIYDNIRKFIRYMLSCNLGEILMMGAAAFLGMPMPLVPIQILWLNLVTDGLPALALGVDNTDDDVMKRKPRKSDEGIFSGGLGNTIVASGLIIGASALLSFSLSLYLTADLSKSRTIAFLVLILSELIYSFECKGGHKNIFKIKLLDNKALLASVFVSCLLTVCIIYIPFFASVFKTTVLSSFEWLMVLCFGLVEFFINSIILSHEKEKKFLITKKASL